MHSSKWLSWALHPGLLTPESEWIPAGGPRRRRSLLGVGDADAPGRAGCPLSHWPLLLGQKLGITPVSSAGSSTSTTRPTRSTWPYTPPSVSIFPPGGGERRAGRPPAGLSSARERQARGAPLGSLGVAVPVLGPPDRRGQHSSAGPTFIQQGQAPPETVSEV